MNIHTNADRRNTGYAAPHNIELEQAVLGACLVNADAVSRISDIVQSGHFYDPLHARIFEAVVTQSEAGRIASPVALAALFEGQDVAPHLTVAKYLGRLAIEATSANNAVDYAKTIRDLATRRGLMQLADDLASAAADTTEGVNPDDIVTRAEAELYALASTGKFGAGAFSFAEAVNDAIVRISDAYQRGNDIVGISSGLTDLDARLGGLSPGELVVLAGRPSMGKTALATNIAVDAALRGTTVDFYSLEMTAEQMATRIIADRVQIGSDKLRRGQISREEFEATIAAAKAIQGVNLFIDETGGLSIGQLAARARRTQRKHGTGLIVVDYLQLMRGAKANSNNRVQEVTEITTGLKALAKELGVPVLALSQLSRQVEARNDKRPMLSDLRESGSIEQDADVVMFVYREEYYVEREKPDVGDYDAYADWSAKMGRCKGLGEVILGKARHGQVGSVDVAWDAARTRFFDLRRAA